MFYTKYLFLTIVKYLALIFILMNINGKKYNIIEFIINIPSHTLYMVGFILMEYFIFIIPNFILLNKIRHGVEKELILVLCGIQILNYLLFLFMMGSEGQNSFFLNTFLNLTLFHIFFYKDIRTRMNTFKKKLPLWLRKLMN